MGAYKPIVRVVEGRRKDFPHRGRVKCCNTDGYLPGTVCMGYRVPLPPELIGFW
jgi:hypothetical protein